MKAIRLRGLLVVAFALAIASVGCTRIGEVAVENGTSSDIFVWNTQVSCDFNSKDEAEVTLTTVQPGRQKRILIAKSSLFHMDQCIAVGDTPVFSTGRRPITLSVEFGNLYVVTRENSRLQIQQAGKHDEPWWIDWSQPQWKLSSTWFLLVVAPYVLGAPVGLYITVRFFYNYYVRKQE